MTKKKSKIKIVSLFFFVVSLWIVLLGRAAYLQFLPHERLNTLQERQFQTVVTLPSRRGNIVDINGKDLAMSAPAYSVYADPKSIDDRRKTARLLAKYLTDSYSKIYSKMRDKDKRFVWIERLVSSDIINKIKEHKIRGIGFVEEWKRVYPNDYMLSSTLGFVGKEGNGLEGIELALDQDLRGENKKVSMRRDAKGRPLVLDGMIFKETPQGKEVKLTIDADLQYFVETELMEAIKKHDADGAYAIVLDAKTSALRAIASLPHYDLNNPQKFNSYVRRNRSVTDTFEPGSTLKTFVIAGALEKNILTPESKIFCENGHFKIGKRVIREAERSHNQGLITVNEVLAYSSNVGTSKIALQLGASNVQEILKKFGFGSRSQVDLPGEAKGIMLGLPWGDHLLANISFGHGITSTPLQMANAYAVIANGGYLNTPYIVERVTDLDTGEVSSAPDREARRVISENVAQEMRKMLVGVTTGKGTGLTARVPGYEVAGKTGTAQKINASARGYLKGAYIASFAGFIPANDPQYVIYVAVDYPKKLGYYGSAIASPLFASIASYAIRKDGLAPNQHERSLANAHDEQHEDTDDFINSEKKLETYSREQLHSISSVITSAPDLKSLTLREALGKVSEKEIKLKIVGKSGRVYRTHPEAGEALDEDRNMTVFMKETLTE